MPPTLLLIRHAQALHNVSKDYMIPDPPLSELGVQQCGQLAEALKQDEVARRVELVIVSPMKRTCQTAVEALGWLIGDGDGEGEEEKKKVKAVADAKWQECSSKPCDTGSPLSSYSSLFPLVDFSSVDPIYPEKLQPANNIYRFTRRHVLARGQLCLKDLYSRPEKTIAVVSHAGFLRTAITNCHYSNADYRIFDFEERQGEGEEEFKIREWERTREAGGGMGWSWKGRAEILEGDFPAETPPPETAPAAL